MLFEPTCRVHRLTYVHPAIHSACDLVNIYFLCFHPGGDARSCSSNTSLGQFKYSGMQWSMGSYYIKMVALGEVHVFITTYNMARGT